MSVSAWGVDHGDELVSKGYKDWNRDEKKAYWAFGTAGVAGSRAPKGQKGKAVREHIGTRYKGALGPAAAGAGIGAGLGAGAALASRGRIKLRHGVGYGSYGAGVVGATYGGQRAGLRALEDEDRRRKVSKAAKVMTESNKKRYRNQMLGLGVGVGGATGSVTGALSRISRKSRGRSAAIGAGFGALGGVGGAYAAYHDERRRQGISKGLGSLFSRAKKPVLKPISSPAGMPPPRRGGGGNAPLGRPQPPTRRVGSTSSPVGVAPGPRRIPARSAERQKEIDNSIANMPGPYAGRDKPRSFDNPSGNNYHGAGQYSYGPTTRKTVRRDEGVWGTGKPYGGRGGRFG